MNEQALAEQTAKELAKAQRKHREEQRNTALFDMPLLN